jgi:flavin reductase (DIM6/NTAB) family NADH-FMN oxidoreductase RutF
MSFREIKLAELDFNPFSKIEEWALLTVGNQQKFNMLTVTGLMMGQFWLRKTLQVYIHPSRYSYPIMNQSQYFSVSFFPEPRCKALDIAGKIHGKDYDKVKETGLTPCFDQNGVYFAESDIVFICRKIYHSDVDESLFDAKDVFQKYYHENTYHRIFIGEIEKVLHRT